MTTAQLSDKWQITVPLSIRKALGLRQRAKVEIELRDNEVILRPVRSVREVRGIFHEAAKNKPADWETVRTETEKMIAEETADEGR